MGASALVACARAISAGSAAVVLLAGCAQLGVEQTSSTPPSSVAASKRRSLPDSSSQGETLTLATASPATQYADLWERIRDGFALPKTSGQPLLRREIDYFAGRQDYLDRVADRARPYLSYIVQALEERDMPSEIALLPIVESAFRPFAYSASKAAGIWQFIPTTGQYYGLQQNWWYDGRRDVIAATQAALDYLQRLNGLFAGDWLLTIAAYNAGEGTVLRAIKHNAVRGRRTDFWHLELPRETKTYVPRLLALRALIATPTAYGLELPTIPNERRIEVVELESQIDLALAAQLAELSLAELYRLNPGYNRWATAPDGPHRLVLPVNHVARFKKELAAIPPEERVHWRRHRVKRGDTLGALARRYHTTTAVLKAVNGLQSSLIRTGRQLVVPLTAQRASATRPNGRRIAAFKTTYVVRRGDSLWRIAQAHQSTVTRICRLNQITPATVLRPGQDLVVPAAQPISIALADSRPPATIQAVRYTVRRGDSLYQIARRFKVTVGDLRRWNNLPEGRFLQPGQKLHLRVDVIQVSDSS